MNLRETAVSLNKYVLWVPADQENKIHLETFLNKSHVYIYCIDFRYFSVIGFIRTHLPLYMLNHFLNLGTYSCVSTYAIPPLFVVYCLAFFGASLNKNAETEIIF